MNNMNIRSRSSVALALVAVFALPGAAQATTYVDRFTFNVSDFEYVRNFWANRHPNATIGGPSPVSTMAFEMLLSYRAPEDRSGEYEVSLVELLEFSAFITVEDIPNLSDSETVITRVRAPRVEVLNRKPVPVLANALGSNNGILFEAEEAGRSSRYLEADFMIYGILGDTIDMTGSYLEFDYRGSPKSFDSPTYRSEFTPSGWSVTRQSEAITPGPVPLPAGIVLSASGLVLLGLARRRRHR